MQRIPLADAISQLRDQLRLAIIEGSGQDIVFTPKEVELELAVTFEVEAEASGGFKLLALLDLSAKGAVTRGQDHKLTLRLDVANAKGEPIKVRSDILPSGL
jgi:hypothetical protein